jgi:general secretion pathway protein L
LQNNTKKKILGLDIRNNAVSAVLLESGTDNRYSIKAHVNNVISEQDKFQEIVGLSLNEIKEKADITGVDCIASFPANHISYRNIKVPFKDEKKICKILDFELEASVILPVEDIMIDFKILQKHEQDEGTPILAAGIEKARLKSYLETLSSYKIDPKVVTIGGYAEAMRLLESSDIPERWIFVDMGNDYTTLFLAVSKKICLIRCMGASLVDLSDAKSVCAHIERTLFCFEDEWREEVNPECLFVLSDDPAVDDLIQDMGGILGIEAKKSDLVQTLDMKVINYPSNEIRHDNAGNALALAVSGMLGTNDFNFRKQEFEVKNKWGHLKSYAIQTGALAIIVLCLALFDACSETYALGKKVSRIESRITDIFKQAFPDVKRIVDPLQQMSVKLKDLKKNSLFPVDMEKNVRIIDILNELSRLIPASIDVKITRLNISSEDLLVSGNADTFNAVDDIKSRIDKSEYFENVQISSASQEKSGKRINFKLKAQL